jgi:hypothetical protein
VVDDSQRGIYFRVPIPPAQRGLIDLNARNPELVKVRQAGLAVDLESIAVLADGRVALLSERLRSLVAQDGVIAEYDSTFAEVGKRGLEGVAGRALENGASRVAVVWEGGYPDFPSLPDMMKGRAGGRSLAPIILVHDIPRNARSGRVPRDAASSFTLEVQRPSGSEPRAQRFRVPDIAWTRLGPSGDYGILALLSSQNGLPPLRYGNLWLQRFDLQGRRSGPHFDLRTVLPENVRAANWEGLCWWEEGQSIALVNEAEGPLGAHAFILDLPQDWRFGIAAASARQ